MKIAREKYLLIQGVVNFRICCFKRHILLDVCKFMHNRSISPYKNGSVRDVSPEVPNPIITVTQEYDRLQRKARLMCFSAPHLLPLVKTDSWARWTPLFPLSISVFFQFYRLQLVSNLLSIVHFILSIKDHICISWTSRCPITTQPPQEDTCCRGRTASEHAHWTPHCSKVVIE